jgi:hypothetical protein
VSVATPRSCAHTRAYASRGTASTRTGATHVPHAADVDLSRAFGTPDDLRAVRRERTRLRVKEAPQ